MKKQSLESYLAGEWSRKNESPGYTSEEVAALREQVAKRRAEIFEKEDWGNPPPLARQKNGSHHRGVA